MRFAIRIGLLLAMCGCSPSSQGPEGLGIFIPAGTPVIDYAEVPLGERTKTLELRRDLVLKEAFGQPFYSPSDIGVAPDGRIFVLDLGNHRVAVFDRDGTPLHSFGREGQGPGEFKGGRHLCLTDDRVVVYDFRSQRLSVFDLDGKLLGGGALRAHRGITEMRGVGKSLIVIDHPGKGVPPTPRPWVVRRYSLEGAPLLAIAELKMGPSAYWETGDAIGTIPMREPFPVGAISRDGTIYISSGNAYRVVAIDSEGVPSWVLSVDYEAPAPTRQEKKAAIQRVEDWLTIDTEPLRDKHFLWPERYAAIEGLEIDGEGNLYVFPHAPVSPSGFTNYMETTEPVPVDVYSPTGARRFSGMSPIGSWISAMGDHVYRIETDPSTEERVVVRYRLGPVNTTEKEAVAQFSRPPPLMPALPSASGNRWR